MHINDFLLSKNIIQDTHQKYYISVEFLNSTEIQFVRNSDIKTLVKVEDPEFRKEFFDRFKIVDSGYYLFHFFLIDIFKPKIEGNEIEFSFKERIIEEAVFKVFFSDFWQIEGKKFIFPKMEGIQAYKFIQKHITSFEMDDVSWKYTENGMTHEHSMDPDEFAEIAQLPRALYCNRHGEWKIN